MMQAFAYRHLVPAEALEVAVSGRFMEPDAPENPQCHSGYNPRRRHCSRVRIATPSSAFVDRFRLELNEPPEGISLGTGVIHQRRG